MTLLIHSGLIQAAGIGGVGRVLILVGTLGDGIQLSFQLIGEVVGRQTLASLFLHITGQVNETCQHIVLVGIATLTTTTLVPLGYLLPAPSTKLAVVVKASVTL